VLAAIIWIAPNFINKDQSSTNKSNKKQWSRLIVDTQKDKREYKGRLKDDTTVFTLMKNIRDKNDLSFSYNKSKAGIFVKKINGIKNDPEKDRFWMYYVNGKRANKGIAQRQLSSGDVVEWKYKKVSNY
jgi:hypothetical protein